MRETLEQIFDNDYQGYQTFLNGVLQPIFGDEMEVLTVEENLTLDDETREIASVKNLIRVASINRVGCDPIEVFDITLKDNTVISRSRVGIQKFIRSAIFPYTHAFMIFHYEKPEGNEWRFSYAYKKNTLANTTDAKRYTYLFGKDLHCRTAIDRFCLLAQSNKDDEAIEEAFSVEAVSKEFFDRYREQYAKFVKYITGKEYVKEGKKWIEEKTGEPNSTIYNAFSQNDKRVRDYIKKMLGRITFLHFLQRKGWLKDDTDFMYHMFKRSDQKANYLEKVLEPLFFGILNTKTEDRERLFKDRGWKEDLLKEWKSFPYLNGGLFEEDEDDSITVTFPEEYFDDLFKFYSEYNFTVDENDPDDAEVGVDPEMLGRIFESLLEDNKDKGAFYTPKEIVRYMCQESLTSYLASKSGIDETKVRNFVMHPYENADILEESEKSILLDSLDNVKICDPAIGSGAFPMGLLNNLVRCEEALILGKEKDYGRAELKKSIIKNNIYGVDIEKGAVDIARLRFWLSIVVDEEKPTPLPNLDYKIMQGNSLLERFQGIDLSHLMDVGDGVINFGPKNRKNLKQTLDDFYSCTDHGKKEKLHKKIIDLVHQQVNEEGEDDQKAKSFSNIDVSANNEFFLWHTWFADVFDRGGFDIVIGNPPYGVSINGEYRRQVVSEIGNVPDYEIYYYFIEIAKKLICEGGILCYIIPNTWLFNTFANRYREAVLDNWKINEILDCSNFKIFKSATVYNSIILFTQYQGGCDLVGFRRTSGVNSFKDLIVKPRIYSRRNRILNCNQNWCLAFKLSDDILDLINKISRNTALECYFPNVSQGLIAYDKHRGQSEQIIKNRSYHYNSYHKGLKPWLWGEDVTRYRVQWNGKEWIDYCDGIANPRSPHFFIGKRLLVREITNPSIYAAITSEELYNDPSILIVKDSDRYSLTVLLAILNSKLGSFYHFNHAPKATKGGFPKILIQDLNQFPLPVVDQNSVNKIESLVHEEIELLNNNSTQTDIYDNIDDKIDKVIYDIYGLSDDETQIIEKYFKH